MRHLSFRLMLRLAVCSLVVTLVVAVIPVPIEQITVDAFAPLGATVDSYGLPWFFFVPGVTIGPDTGQFFIRRFACDWLFWFGVFVMLFLVAMILTESFRHLAYLRAQRRRHPKIH